MAGIKETPGNKLHERLNQNSIKLWIFMGRNRLLVTGLLVIIVFITLLVAGSLYPAVENSIRSSDSIDTLFQALLTAIISGVTIVVSLNQLVLSQELGAVKDQRERMEGAMQFRENVADVIQAPLSPSKPAQFIRALVQVSAERARKLQDIENNSADEEFKQEINDFTDSLIKNSEQVANELDGSQFGEFDVISSALNFNYSWKIFTAKRIKTKYSDLLSEKGEKELEKLIEVLNLFGPTREHFKTLYFQSNLIDLSRRILLAAIPALLVSCYMIIFLTLKPIVYYFQYRNSDISYCIDNNYFLNTFSNLNFLCP
ncbi:hypothetical protein DFR79_13716 [Halanaerobium saccharolyticum]|uniref:Uncharacterized protein n=1 Tax=Halanaerobium saccharolyticum TaxID=43595 RepID=A0A4R6LFN7_9FIRM|nr:hypothetical protein [Halanaerobium saccharolyticum]TDO73399.1 hypothetical protein DFR79_13716 [Halanaerobium saccharolyticum]